jgi:biopolymer transport protein ExbD
MSGIGTLGEESDNPVEINAAAMVDVTLCLCAFFLCSFHYKQLEGKVETWLPKERRHDYGCWGAMDEVRIFMTWDAERQSTLRRVGNRAAVSTDAELLDILRQYPKDFKKAGRTQVPILIDATEAVPWLEIVHVVDLCRNENLSVIRFAAPVRSTP